MSEEKVCPIIEAHKLKMLQLVPDSLDKGWKTLSAQVAELQLLRADRDNSKVQGQGFFKLTKEAISTVQDNLARDLYGLATTHGEEITPLMEEFNAHDIDTSVKLDNNERNLWQQTTEPGASAAQPQPPP